jgi:hypothetical protein
MQGFMHLLDFDGEGKEDIFTYQTAGIKVYKNVSDTVLKFELFTEQILSTYYQNQNPVNLFCTDGDYVAVADMDRKFPFSQISAKKEKPTKEPSIG